MADEKMAEGEDEEILSDIVRNLYPQFVTKNINKALLTMASSLMQKGVQKQIIMDALAAIKPQITLSPEEIEEQRLTALRYYAERRDANKFTGDFAGKAVIARVEKYFHSDKETEETILKQPIPGVLPRAISSGIIDAVKSFHGEEPLEKYEKFLAQKAERYRRKSDKLIEVKAFLEDADVKQVGERMVEQFKRLFEQKSVEERKIWLLHKLHTSQDYAPMKRDLTDDEYNLVLTALFG
jgi:hypothetical protein